VGDSPQKAHLITATKFKGNKSMDLFRTPILNVRIVTHQRKISQVKQTRTDGGETIWRKQKLCSKTKTCKDNYNTLKNGIASTRHDWVMC
jgi:hypothetical protein